MGRRRTVNKEDLVAEERRTRVRGAASPSSPDQSRLSCEPGLGTGQLPLVPPTSLGPKAAINLAFRVVFLRVLRFPPNTTFYKDFNFQIFILFSNKNLFHKK